MPHSQSVEEQQGDRERSHKRTRDREEEEEDRPSTRTKRENRPRYFEIQNNIPKALVQKETEEKRLSTRQKQIDYGKNTIGYQRYTSSVKREQRKKTDPWTPDKNYKCSKRSWDGQIRKWRRLLHEYDPPTAEGEIEIDLENDEDDLSELQKRLDDVEEEDFKVDDKENKKNETNKTIKAVESKPEPKASLKFDFLEPFNENERWADMC